MKTPDAGDIGTGKFRNSQVKNVACCIWSVISSAKNMNAAGHSFKRAVVDWGVPHWKYQNGPINVSIDIDDEIPHLNRSKIYMSYLWYPMEVIGFTIRQFGRKEMQSETREFLNGMANLYVLSGQVYRRTQTTIVKPSNGSLLIKIIRKLVPPNCMFPSLHVQIVCHSLFYANRIIEEQGNTLNYPDYQSQIYQKAVGIIESCLLTKQHALADIAAGFFAYGAVNKSFAGSGLAESIINGMFRELEQNSKMSAETVSRVKAEIGLNYQSMLADLSNRRSDHVRILLKHIDRL